MSSVEEDNEFMTKDDAASLSANIATEQPEEESALLSRHDKVFQMLLQSNKSPAVSSQSPKNNVKGDQVVNEMQMDKNVELVQRTFEDMIRPRGLEFTHLIFKTLMDENPEVAPIFKVHSMRALERMLLQALSLVVENLRNKKYLRGILHELGRRHVSYGVIPQYFEYLKGCYERNLREFLKEVWDDECEQAWMVTFDSMVEMMLSENVTMIEKGEKTSDLNEATNDHDDENDPSSGKRKGPGRLKRQGSKFGLPLDIKAVKYVENLLHMFWNAPDWIIVSLALLCYLAISLYIDEKSLLGRVFDESQEVTFILGLVLYFKEAPTRRRNFQYQAFGVIDAASSNRMSVARIMAMEDLNGDQVSLKGFDGMDKDFTGCRLPRANLTHANFTNANLSNSLFVEGTFDYANLANATATHASFQGASLNFVKMEGAKLNGSSFEHASFVCAKLAGADFTGANLKGAKLSGADLEGTFLVGADLTGAKVSNEALKRAILYHTILPSGERSS